jgi:acyl carrier protein
MIEKAGILVLNEEFSQRAKGLTLASRGNLPLLFDHALRYYYSVIFTHYRKQTMATTFEAVAEIISETSDIPLEEITPEKNAFTDLGIDSLDFLDIAFAIDKHFGIKIPLEQWTEELNENNALVDEYFVLSKLCARIDDVIAAKDA